MVTTYSSGTLGTDMELGRRQVGIVGHIGTIRGPNGKHTDRIATSSAPHDGSADAKTIVGGITATNAHNLTVAEEPTVGRWTVMAGTIVIIGID